MPYKDKEREKLFWIWSDMCWRCKNSNHKAYKNYGARGITVCERWKIYQNFVDDMAPRPKGLMLDRIDNDKGYSPENCHWVTRKQQNINRRSCYFWRIKGTWFETAKLAAKHFGVGRTTIIAWCCGSNRGMLKRKDCNRYLRYPK